MPSEDIPFGSEQLKARKNDQRLWAVRSTLMRKKRPEKIGFNSYEPALRDNPVGDHLDPKHPPPNPFRCADDCSVCSPQFFPASLSVNDDQARKLITSITDSIKSDLSFLRDALAKNADFLVSRWKKKSREKRHNFLTTNTDLFDDKWAAIHLLHRVGPPDRRYKGERNLPKVRTIRTSNGGYAITLEMHTPQSLSDAELRDKTLASYQDSWFLPYLDAQTLSEDPSLFLSLLHHRTIHEPEEWLPFDNASVVLVEQFAIISSIFNPNCVVVKGPEYGKLVKWKAEEAHRWETIGFTKARVLLTAQQKMMTLLRKCVTSLLAEADTPPTLTIHPKWNDMVSCNFSRFKTNFAWSTDFAKPFSDPPIFNPREVAELIASRHRVIKDELELLQLDPEYVQSLVKELSACLFFESFRKEDVMPFLVDHLFFETMHRESYWRQLAAESEQMLKHLNSFEERPSEKARRDFDHAVYIVQDLCIETFAVFEPQVEAGLLLQRGFERNFRFKGNGKFKSTNRSFSKRDWFPEDVLYWSLSTLGYDEDRPFTMDPSLNFGIIDHLCRTDPKQADRIGQTMLDRLSDMSVLSDIISSIRSDTTGDRALDARVIDAFPTRTTSPADWVRKINAEHGRALGDMLGPDLQMLCQQFPWPRGKKDRRWLEEATAARASLTKLWDHFEQLWVGKLEKAQVSKRLIDEDIMLLHAASSDRNLADLKAEKEEIDQLLTEQSVKDLSQKNALGEIQTVWGKENDSLTSLPTRLRAKTAPAADHTDKDVALPTACITGTVIYPQRKIEVKVENLVMFKHMFPSRGVESQRSFSWQHFLNAMGDAGFSILQSQGSAVTLKLGTDEGNGVKTIVFHRPHPVPTVNPVMLRRFAKRMQKWFG